MFASPLYSHVLLALALTFHAGQQPFSFAAPQLTAQVGVASSRISGLVWYPVDASVAEQPQSIGNPAHPLFDAGNAAVGAPIATSPAAFPLILLSHGTGGSAHQLAWLGTALARAGFIAVAIDHPGDTSQGDLTVQGFTLWWLRARELSAALDAIEADPALGPHVDRTRIAAAGFSIGGYTTIAIAGGRVDFSAFEATCAKNLNSTVNCQSPPEFPDLVEKATALEKSDPSYAKALAGSMVPVADSRVRAIYAIAPPAGDAVTTQSLQAIRIPVRIAYGTNDTTVTPPENAMVYAKTIPGATLLTVTGAAHYTFLDTCTAFGVQRIGTICLDAPGVDRDAVHALVASDAIAYFDRALGY
jgi:predicted dienelactone hydrolase